MADNLTLAVRLKFDGKEVVGGINVSREQFRKLAADARRAGEQMAGGFSGASNGVRSISGMLAQARDVMLGFVAVSSVRRAVDGFAELNARIALVETSARDARNAFAGVFGIAQAGGQDLDTVAQVYVRIARNARTLGLDQQAVLQTTQAVANAVRLSGASAESARGALIQFGQALASGTLRGDELNSIMEQTPALAEAVARGMGKTVGELRKMGEEGRLTAAEVIGAIRSESARLESEASQMADTIDKSLARLGNAWQRYLGENASGAARAASASINALADNFDKLANTVVAAGAGFAAVKFSGWVAGAGGLAAALSRIHPVTAVIGTAVTALGFAFQDFQRKGEGAAEGVRTALDKLQSGAARVTMDLRGMTVANVNKALADLERDRTRLAADLDKQRKERDALRERRLASREDISRRDRLSADVLGAEQSLERLDKELAGIRANMKDAGRRDIENYFNTFGDKAEQTRKKLANLQEATQKALKAAAGTLDPAGERARILANEARVKREILRGGRGEPAANGNKERLALAETLAAQTDRLQADALQREISGAKTAFEARKLSAGEYYRYLIERQQQLEQMEIAALERRRDAAAAEISRAPPGSPDSLRAQTEVAKLNTDITLAERRLADLRNNSDKTRQEVFAAAFAAQLNQINIATNAMRAEIDALNNRQQAGLLSSQAVRREILRIEQQTAEATGEQVKALEILAKELGPEYVTQAKQARNEWERMTDGSSQRQAAAAEETGMIEAQIALLRSLNAMNQATVAARRQAGISTEMESLREQEAANRRNIQLLRAEQALLQQKQAMLAEMGNAAGAMQVQAQINQVEASIISLSAQLDLVADKFRDIFESRMVEAINAVIDGTKTLKEAFRSMIAQIAADIAKMIAKDWVQQFIKLLSGKGGDNPKLGGRGFFSFLADAIFPGTGKGFKLFAGGGYVSGPGTATSDSIPARLSAGEYVIRAAAVKQFGVSFLDAINGLKRAPRVLGAGGLAFAAGGLVPQAAAAPQALQAIQIVNSLDPSVTLDHLQSAAGARIILNTISANPRAVRAALGG